MSNARPLGAKLYLEGIEVPFIGATITTQVGAASIAYIDLVPHHYITDIKPRTHVLLAVRDYHNKSENYPYVVAWEGEVFGYSFNKTPMSRMFSISCIDYTSYWDNVLTYFFNTQVSLGKGEDILPIGLDYASSKAQGITPVSVGHSLVSYMKKIIEDKMKTGADFLGGIVAVMDEIGKLNDFYKASEDRLKISKRIALRSSGQLDKLLAEKESLDWFNNIIGGESGFSTLRGVILDLCSIIFHDQVTLTFPSSVLEETKTGDTTKRKVGEFKEFVFKPNLFTIPPPACNVFFPDEYSSFTFSRQFFREPTRLVYKPELPLQGGEGVALPHAYSPSSFNAFMIKNAGEVTVGSGDLEVDKDPGHYGDQVKDDKATKTKREWQFLTNEEKMRGILLATENLVPASNEFRAALGAEQRNTFTSRVADYLFYKKRFQTREFQITGHLKLSVVPGFNALVLDNSASGQNIIAYVTSITHRIYATEGGYTTATFAYARTPQEQQTTSKSANDPLIPPWFKAEIFGNLGPATVSQKDQETVGSDQSGGNRYVGAAENALSDFYKDLLGSKGNSSLCDMYKDKKTVIAAIAALLDEYQKYKEKPGADILDFIGEKTDRAYIRVRDGFNFIGATMDASTDLRTASFTEFNGGAFDPSGKLDANQITARRNVVKQYRDILKAQRGFKG